MEILSSLFFSKEQADNQYSTYGTYKEIKRLGFAKIRYIRRLILVLQHFWQKKSVHAMSNNVLDLKLLNTDPHSDRGFKLQKN
jgi:hypothetical protein